MVENTRSHDQQRLEEFVKESLKEITSRLQIQEDNISTLNYQNDQIMTQFKGDQGGGQPHGGSYEGVTQGRCQYLATRQTKVDFLRYNGDDLNG